MPDKPLPDHELITPYALDIHTINRRLFQPKPDPAQPVAATVEPLLMVEELTTTHTYHCQMPHQMFHKLFNQQDLPHGFSIEHVYGHDLVLVTYDPTDDIPCHPDTDVTDDQSDTESDAKVDRMLKYYIDKTHDIKADPMAGHSSNCLSRYGWPCDCEDM